MTRSCTVVLAEYDCTVRDLASSECMFQISQGLLKLLSLLANVCELFVCEYCTLQTEAGVLELVHECTGYVPAAGLRFRPHFELELLSLLANVNCLRVLFANCLRVSTVWQDSLRVSSLAN
jgi:hypothetical protein